MHSSSKIGWHSWGGPGISMISLRYPLKLVSSHWPGALPLGLVNTVAPSITSACFRLLSGIGIRHVAARTWRAATCVASRRSESERASAAASRVRSSSVGPRPPMRITMSTRPSAVRNGRNEVLAAIADDRLEGHGYADFVELFSQVEGIGVLAERGQHFRPDSDDFGFHKCSFLLLASRQFLSFCVLW